MLYLRDTCIATIPIPLHTTNLVDSIHKERLSAFADFLVLDIVVCTSGETKYYTDSIKNVFNFKED